MDQAQRLRNLVRGGRTGEPLASAAAPASTRRQTGERPRVLAVTSGKGGVGKSNLTVNLALCLARLGRRTWLWDVDLGLGNVDILLGLSPGYNLGHVVFGDRTLEEITVDGPEGLKVIPAGSGWQELAQLSQWRLNRLVTDLALLEQNADFVLLDTGAGIGRGVVQFALAAQETILVVTPEPTSLADAYSLLKVVWEANGEAEVRLVVNQVTGEGEAKTVHERFNHVVRRFLQREVEMLGSVPRDDAVAAAVRRQRPFVLAYPESPAAQAVEKMARRLCGMGGPPRRRLGFQGVVRRMVSLLRR